MHVNKYLLEYRVTDLTLTGLFGACTYIGMSTSVLTCWGCFLLVSLLSCCLLLLLLLLLTVPLTVPLLLLLLLLLLLSLHYKPSRSRLYPVPPSVSTSPY